MASSRRSLKQAFCSFIALFILSGAATPSWSREKSDIVTLHNGDQVTCEIKSLYAGLLECSTSAMGTLNIEWEEIASIFSDYEFQVRYSDGSRFIGRIDEAGEPRKFTVTDGSRARATDWLQVVELRALQTTLKDAMDIYFSAGYDYTKASDSSQVTIALDMSYEKELSRSTLNLRHNISDTREESTTSTKLDLFRGFAQDETRKLFRYGSSSYEKNDQLELDYRVSLGGGFGRYFIDNHERQLVSTLGLQANTESDSANDQKESLELAMKLVFASWRFTPPELDVKFTLNLFPSLTDRGRLRGDSDLRFRWELYRDLFWDVSSWSVYDNRNTGEDDFDYGVSTGVGWDF